jgi:hypothetical protein
VPVLAWIVLAVVALHGIAFWLLADRHYLPPARYIPPPPAPNFAARRQTRIDPRTGEITTETEYVVSTHLASPRPSSTGPAAP